MRTVASLIILLSLISCGKPKSIVGSWKMDAPFGLMAITFSEDGSYDGTLSGNLTEGPVHGTYALTDEGLVMDPPRITTKTGSTIVPPGGAMRMQMKWISDDTVELFNGQNTFRMSKQPKSN